MRKPAFLFAIAVGVVFSPPALAEDPDPVTLLKDMSSSIAATSQFVIHGSTYADRRLDEGQMIEHGSKVTVHLQRPGSLRLTREDTVEVKEIIVNDGVLTVSMQPRNFYTEADVPEGLEQAVEFAIDELGMDAPLMDLLMEDVADNLTQDATNVNYLGTTLVRGTAHHHVGIRGPEIDVQVFIPTEGDPLPGKIVMTSKWEGGAPRFIAVLDWDTNPEMAADAFDFTPPEGAVKIEFVPELN